LEVGGQEAETDWAPGSALPDDSWEKQNPCQVSPRHTIQTENAKKRLFSSVLTLFGGCERRGGCAFR